MKYENLTIHQKISIKEIIRSKKRRKELGIDSDGLFNGLNLLSLIDKSFKLAINIFLVKVL